MENEYQRLMNISIEANTALRHWKEKCATIYLDGGTHNFELRLIHELLCYHFPEVIQSRRISDGGSNKMTLIAPVDDLKASLSLVLEMSLRIKNKYNETINNIINDLETGSVIKLDPNHW